MAERHSELDAAGLKIAALSVEGLDDTPVDKDQLTKLVERLQLPFLTGTIGADFYEQIDASQRGVVNQQ